ncbi:MAG: hypothetical protein IKK57_09905 [Clostridia bacterium]|nr:hypothetical protein [Clostridia bacterium]
MIIKKKIKKQNQIDLNSNEKQEDFSLLENVETTVDTRDDVSNLNDKKENEVVDETDIFAGFNFDEITFNQRAERRRGDRRRGYRGWSAP